MVDLSREPDDERDENESAKDAVDEVTGQDPEVDAEELLEDEELKEALRKARKNI